MKDSMLINVNVKDLPIKRLLKELPSSGCLRRTEQITLRVLKNGKQKNAELMFANFP